MKALARPQTSRPGRYTRVVQKNRTGRRIDVPASPEDISRLVGIRCSGAPEASQRAAALLHVLEGRIVRDAAMACGRSERWLCHLLAAWRVGRFDAVTPGLHGRFRAPDVTQAAAS
jgi:hypothetical protein